MFRLSNLNTYYYEIFLSKITIVENWYYVMVHNVTNVMYSREELNDF